MDVRLIAATNRNLLHEVETGHFREDLSYRLSVHFLSIPPLRERTADIASLMNYYLEQACQQLACVPLRLEQNALKALELYV